MTTYVILRKRQFSHKDSHYWNFEGIAYSESDRGEFIAVLEEEIKRTKDMRLRTLGYKVVELD